jgi:tRNA-Thr(GGU) m(6)t(6)A37 methyltransferase TsaA
MAQHVTMPVVAHIQSDFSSKFGIPRQSGLVDELKATVVFEPEFRIPEALRGLEEFSHIWLIWQFSGNASQGWHPTVRPPRLGGNARMGVFATRSPFRPSPIGLSCVRLERVEWSTPQGAVLHVSGADLMDGTPILDIKPYLPYADAHPEALGGFANAAPAARLRVEDPAGLLNDARHFPPEKREALLAVLAQDPRPAYQRENGRVYGFDFAGYSVRFCVTDDVLTLQAVEKCEAKN